MKPAWKSTEFWLTVAASLVGALLASGVFPDAGVAAKALGVVATVLSSLGYTVARTYAKISANRDTTAQALATTNPQPKP